MSIKGKQFRTEITSQGELKLSLETVTFPEPKEDEVLVRVQASPINLRWISGCTHRDCARARVDDAPGWCSS
jgi:hypothetical protein